MRSDQYNFILQGVPALSFKFDAAPGTPEAKVMAEWLKTRYHAPSDDTKQPVLLEDAARFNDILLDMAETIGNQAERPRWNENSFSEGSQSRSGREIRKTAC